MYQIFNIVGGNVEIRPGAHRKFNEGGIRISDLPLFVWILPIRILIFKQILVNFLFFVVCQKNIGFFLSFTNQMYVMFILRKKMWWFEGLKEAKCFLKA